MVCDIVHSMDPNGQKWLIADFCSVSDWIAFGCGIVHSGALVAFVVLAELFARVALAA